MRGLKRMKKHITRAEAEQKYGVSSTKLYKLVRQGLLRRHDAEAMGFETNRAGPRIRWVYAEEDIVALAKRSPSRALVHRNPEKIVFDLFDMGSMQMTALSVPGMQSILHTAPLSITEWGIIGVVALPLFLVPEITKRVIFKK